MKLSPEEYMAQFQDKEKGTEVISKQKAALERAWKNRDFEIELYWKRATYFWAFTAATFTGYFFVLRFAKDIANPYLELVLAIMGFVFSLSWYRVNIGSKKWQENWEGHIDLLEDEITGPLYKTTKDYKINFSVSKVNILASAVVIIVWIFLGINYFIDNISFCSTAHNKPAWLVIGSAILVGLFIVAVFIYGRSGTFSNNAKYVTRDKKDDAV